MFCRKSRGVTAHQPVVDFFIGDASGWLCAALVLLIVIYTIYGMKHLTGVALAMVPGVGPRGLPRHDRLPA
jgi:hypothetical protein